MIEPMSNESASAIASPVQDYLQELHTRYSNLREGQVATYIPELAKANPDWFGICLVTTEGHVYEVGDSRQNFTIQSISKPFVYGLALEDNTRAEVLKKISVEPTGDAFNAISLEPGTGRPRNPMINAGANPLTNRQAIRGEYVESILSVMGSCGMYDYAGEWLYRVGMPAKSGVAGGVIAVLPGQLGIGVFSPPLDGRGNSVRGLAVCDDLSGSFDLHLFNNPN